MTRRRAERTETRTGRRAVAYARVSSAEQEREGFSIPAQLRLLRDYARDEGLVEKTDRLYRNLKDWVTLDELDPDIHFVKEGTVLSPDSRSADKFMHGIRVLMAKNYIDNLSEEVKKGMAEKAAQGYWPTKTPLGYRNATSPQGQRIIVVDPEVAPLIRQLFEWYATGRSSLHAITRMARDAGLRHRSGTPLPKATVHRILGNPLYTGDIVWDDRRYRGVHEPIISRQLFERVQDVLRGKPGKHRQTKRDFAFAGLLTCGHCGCSLTGEMKKGRYMYYHCTGYRGKCGEPYVREERLEEHFTDLLGLLKIELEILDWITDALRHSHGKTRRIHDEVIKRLTSEHDKLQRRLDAMYVDKLDGRVDAATFDRLAEQWRTEQDRLLKSIEEHREGKEVYYVEGAKILELASRSQELFANQPPEEKRKLLDFLLSNCSWSNGELAPAFRQPFDSLVNTRKTAICQEREATAREQKIDKSEIWYAFPYPLFPT